MEFARLIRLGEVSSDSPLSLPVPDGLGGVEALQVDSHTLRRVLAGEVRLLGPRATEASLILPGHESVRDLGIRYLAENPGAFTHMEKRYTKQTFRTIRKQVAGVKGPPPTTDLLTLLFGKPA
jgi:hypothetical protein